MRIIIGFISLLFISNTIFGQFSVKYDTIQLFESSKLKEELRKGEIFKNIIDTIKSDQIYNDFVWVLNEKIDEVNQQIYFQLVLDQGIFLDDYCIKERNIFFIELSKFDSVFVEGKFTNRIDTFGEVICEFIGNPEMKETLPEKKLKIIKYFDTVEVSKQMFEINAVMIADSMNNKSSWTTQNEIINMILKSYSEIRDELSKSEWNKTFQKLDFEKQVAIIQYYPINFWIFQNRPRLLPPPPPPYEFSEEYILDSINNYYREKAIEELLNK